MLQWGGRVVDRIDSLCNNPLVTIIKPDGFFRLYPYAQKLNTILIPIQDASPPIDDILEKFNKKSFSPPSILRLVIGRFS